MIKPKYVKNVFGDEFIVVPLCKGCIEDLKEYNPWLTSKGKDMPLAHVLFEEVTDDKCYNTIITQ